jgi:hypothetical protein
MMYVLTGDRQYQKESQSIGGKMSQQKRQMRQRRKGKRFTHKPDRTVNEKKRRRASAQKADISIVKEQEQPFIKADVDAPMEVVEVNHEDADTAIMQEDDQGIEYNIDEYLDDTCKHSQIHSLYFRHPPSRLHRASQALG